MPLGGLGEFKPPAGAVPDPPPTKKKRRTSNATTAPAQPTPALQDLLPPPLSGNLYISHVHKFIVIFISHGLIFNKLSAVASYVYLTSVLLGLYTRKFCIT